MKKTKPFIFSIIIGVADLVFCYWLLGHFQELMYPVLILIFPRILVAVALFFFVKPLFKDNPYRSNIIIFLLSTLYFVYSFFGIIAFLFALKSLDSKKTKDALLYHIDREEGEQDTGFSQGISQEIAIDEMRKVAPLMDGLTDEDKNSRIAAIQAMEQVIDARSIRKALISAKADPNKEVQYFINDALKKVTEDAMGNIKNQLDMINQSEPSYASYKKMADLYAAIANTNIDHPVLVQFYHQESAKYYAFILENYPDYKTEVMKELIPALYQSKAYEKCLDLCDEMQGQSELSSIALLYKCRTLFSLKRISALKHLTSTINLDGLISQDNLFNTPPGTHG